MVTYDEAKRLTNIQEHDGIDFAECEPIFDAPMFTEEDTREAYGEQRLKSFGWFRGRVVVLIWTERVDGPHLISCHHGDKHEIRKYYEAFTR